MKKSILLLVLSITALTTNAQKKRYSYQETPIRLDSITNGLIYTETIDVDGITKETLFERAKSFVFTSLASSSTNIIESTNSDIWNMTASGFIETAPNMAVAMLSGGQQMNFKIDLQLLFKDNRYKYVISNLRVVNKVTQHETVVDQGIRNNPASFQKKIDKGLNQSQYDKFMGEKNDVMVFINKLKVAVTKETVTADF